MTKFILGVVLTIISFKSFSANFDGHAFAKKYFYAMTKTQSPDATKADLENYLSLLVNDIGHQHLPYDADDSREPDGKSAMRKGMIFYLGGHDHYKAKLIDVMVGDDVVIIKYNHKASGYHPQMKKQFSYDDDVVEVLEIEDGKISVIRKYSL